MTDPVRPKTGALRWRDVDVRAYKQDASAPFRDVTRQVLFDDPAPTRALAEVLIARTRGATL